MHHGTLQGPHQDESDEWGELNEGLNTTPTKRKIKRVARAKGGLQDKIDEVSQWRQHPPVVWGTEPFVDHVARCRIAAHHTHVGKRSAHLKYQERTVAICVSHRPGLFAERYFHHGIDLNAQVGTYNVTPNRLGPGLSRKRTCTVFAFTKHLSAQNALALF